MVCEPLWCHYDMSVPQVIAIHCQGDSKTHAPEGQVILFCDRTFESTRILGLSDCAAGSQLSGQVLLAIILGFPVLYDLIKSFRMG